MKPVLDIKPVRIGAGTVHTIEDGKGLQVTVLDGVVWLTQAEDVRDLILAPGQRFVLDRNGRAVVYALKQAATLLVGPAGHVATAAHRPTAPPERNAA
jgi:Protein of unknown function (DUF2917)